jgi:hypothetical protein
MDYLDLLRRHDDPRSWEYPPGFDYKFATRRFAKFTEALSSALGLALKSEDDLIQARIIVEGLFQRFVSPEPNPIQPYSLTVSAKVASTGR